MLLGLKGEVVNLSNGAVRAHIEGNADRVKQMLHLLNEGPSLARVDRVDVSPTDPTGKYETFEVGLAR